MSVDALKGSSTQTLRTKRATELPAFGAARECTKSDLERVVKLMLEKGRAAHARHAEATGLAG